MADSRKSLIRKNKYASISKFQYHYEIYREERSDGKRVLREVQNKHFNFFKIKSGKDFQLSALFKIANVIDIQVYRFFDSQSSKTAFDSCRMLLSVNSKIKRRACRKRQFRGVSYCCRRQYTNGNRRSYP